MESGEATAIELNDVGVILADAAGLSAPSPGIAFFDGERLLTGKAALSLCRTVPTQANDCFWDDLNQEPLSQPLGSALSTADLVHAHLSSLWASLSERPAEAIIALSSAFDRERMGLLLGIMQSIPIPVVGVVDSAVLCATAVSERVRNVVHVDLLLHRCVITRVTRNDGWVRESVDVVDDCGWLSLLELWSHAIADRFIRTTRFDPLHAAADEQRLSDLLPGCLATLASEKEVDLEIGPAERGHRVVVPRKEIIQATSSRLEALLSRIQGHVGLKDQTLCQITSRLRACPGFEALARETLPCGLEELPEGFAAIKARQQANRLRGKDGRVPFVTRVRDGNPVGLAPLEAADGS